MMTRTLSRIAVSLGLAAALAACAHDRTQAASDSNASGSATIYPAGIVVPGDYADAAHAGIYASDAPKTCCFLAGSALLTLDNPPGAQLAVFTFYVPSVAPLLKNAERVHLNLNGKPAGAPAVLSPGMQDVTFAIPASLRQRRHLTAALNMSVKWVPKKIGLNEDRRELSVMLVRIGYI